MSLTCLTEVIFASYWIMEAQVSIESIFSRFCQVKQIMTCLRAPNSWNNTREVISLRNWVLITVFYLIHSSWLSKCSSYVVTNPSSQFQWINCDGCTCSSDSSWCTGTAACSEQFKGRCWMLYACNTLWCGLWGCWHALVIVL